MKSLLQFIKESASTKLLTLVNNLHYDFTDTSNLSKEDKAKAQEKILIDTINNLDNEYKAIGVKEYCKLINKTYSDELDSKIGDIIIMKDNKPVLFIDLNVAETDKYLGTPNMLSLVNFAEEDDDKKYYLCCKINGVGSKLIKANKVYTKVLSKEASVIASKNRSNISPKVKELTNKVKLFAPNNMNNVDTTKLYDDDFVSTSSIQNL